MARTLYCPKCWQQLRLDESLKLLGGRCPVCRTAFRIPTPRSSNAAGGVQSAETAGKSRPSLQAAVRTIYCPSCLQALRLTPHQQLKAGQCPVCATRFRLPPPCSVPQLAAAKRQKRVAAARQQTPKPHSPTADTPSEFSKPLELEVPLPRPQRAKANKQAPGPSESSEGAGSIYGVQGGANNPPPLPIVTDHLPEDELQVFANAPASGRRRRGRKKIRGTINSDVSNLLITTGVLALLWLLLTVLVLFKPDVALMMLLFGGIIYLISRLWFLFAAWEEGMEKFLLCAVVPFYDWYCFYLNSQRYARAMVMRFLGALTLFSAALVFFLHPEWEDYHLWEQPPQASPPVQSGPSPLVPPAPPPEEEPD